MAAPADRDVLISQFCSFTQAGPEEAENMLASSEWNVEAAVALWYQSQEEDNDDEFDNVNTPSHAPPKTSGNTLGSSSDGGRALGSGPAQPSASSSSSQPPRQTSTQRRQQGGMRTLKDLQSERGHDHDDDDDAGDNGQDFFAGGEKSGLAVQNPGQNPNDLVNRVLQKARENAPRPGGEDPASARSHFHGRGVTLGGEGQESQIIEDPQADEPQSSAPVERTLHIWRNGFSVDDGPLHPNSEPQNQVYMAQFANGQAPLHILDVQPGQAVNVNVDNQQDQDYVKPKAKYKPFSGQGQRLGSPTPGVAAPSASTATPASATAPSQATMSSPMPAPSINQSEPTVRLQIRLGDGTRLVSNFNTTNTIGDVYGFVDSSSPASRQRAYVLQTTFPPRELTDRSQRLEDTAELSRGGVVVQKWK